MAAANALYLMNDSACYELYYEVYTGERKNDSGLIAQEMKVIHDPKQLAHIGLNEGMGFVPFSGSGDPSLLSGVEPRLSDPRREVRLAAAATVIRLMHVAETQAVEDRKIRPAASLREQINQRQRWPLVEGLLTELPITP